MVHGSSGRVVSGSASSAFSLLSTAASGKAVVVAAAVDDGLTMGLPKPVRDALGLAASSPTGAAGPLDATSAGAKGTGLLKADATSRSPSTMGDAVGSPASNAVASVTCSAAADVVVADTINGVATSLCDDTASAGVVSNAVAAVLMVQASSWLAGRATACTASA